MKIRMNIMRYAMAIVCMAVAAACSDSDDWQAGPKTKDGCQQVRFVSTDNTFTVLDDENPDDRTVTIAVKRSTTEGALTVPMSIEEKSDGLDIPTEVLFADGQQQSEFTITVTGEAVKGTSYSYALRLTGDEIDPYLSDGGSTIEGTISFPAERRAKMWIMGAEDVLGYWNATVLDMGGGRYRIKDLMESGLELNITLDADNNISMDSPMWHVDGIDYKEEDNYYPGYYYYFCNLWNYDTNQYEYYPFYPHGKDAYVWIEQMVMYSGDNAYAAYYKDLTDNTKDYFYIYLCTLKLSTEKKAHSWEKHYLCFRFLEDGETLENYLPEEEVSQPSEPSDEVTFTASFGTYNDTFGGAFNVTAKKVGDGSYLFEDFLGCGDDITISIDEATGRVTFEGNYGYVWEDYFYLVASDGYNAAYVYPNKDAAPNYINYMYFDVSGGANGSCWNAASKTFELKTGFYLNENFDDAYDDCLYLKLNE